MPRTGRVAAAALLVLTVAGTGRPVTALPAQAPQISSEQRVPMSDGVELEVRLGGVGPLVDGRLPARPVIVEFSPYGPGCCFEAAGPEYNYLQVHIRGTGQSDGSFDSLGPRTQQDVVEVLRWACDQPWSNRRIGLLGFSASAIAVYNSLHLELPCVQTAVLGSGTHELYRDLLYPGGVPNQMPATGVLALIGAPAAQAFPDRLGRAPLTFVEVSQGLTDSPRGYRDHPTLDSYWQERGFRGDVNDLPILMTNGFFDVESRGAFQAFQELRDDGAHLLVVGAHDGVPVGSGGSDDQRHAWFDRYLRDVDNGIDAEPAVQLFLADGDREDMLDGRFVTTDGPDWPIPGTTWVPLALDAAPSGTATSVNDGTLGLGPAAPATQSYPAVPSAATATDPHNAAILGIFNNSPTLTDMTLAEPLGLSYTTQPFATDVLAAGPASLELVLSSTAPETDIWAVLSDVSPDGVAHPMATGRLRSAYPDVDRERSLVVNGDIVQPYGRYDTMNPAAPTAERLYRVELWPIGNRFAAGHRLRLHVLGASAASEPNAPAVNTIRLGPGASRLLFPVLPGSDLAAALGTGAVAPPAPDVPATAPTDAAAAPRSAAGGRLPATGGVTSLAPVVLLLVVLVTRACGRARRWR